MSLINSFLPSLNRSSSPTQTGDSASAAVRPRYQVSENDDAYTVTVQLPGVTKESLTITDEQGVLTIRGERNWKQPAGWTLLYRESSDTAYQLALQHENAIDPDKINAELVDGVLRLTLPKAEARKPRKIAVS